MLIRNWIMSFSWSHSAGSLSEAGSEPRGIYYNRETPTRWGKGGKKKSYSQNDSLTLSEVLTDNSFLKEQFYEICFMISQLQGTDSQMSLKYVIWWGEFPIRLETFCLYCSLKVEISSSISIGFRWTHLSLWLFLSAYFWGCRSWWFSGYCLLFILRSNEIFLLLIRKT